MFCADERKVAPFQVITPQRFGDVFLYNNGRFPPFDDDFSHSTTRGGLGGSSPFNLGDAFSSLSLIHGQCASSPSTLSTTIIITTTIIAPPRHLSPSV